MVYAGKRWSETLADCLLEMDFTPCKAEPDIWMRKKGDLYKYIASYLADLAIASKNPKEIIEELQTRHNFKSKGTGPPTSDVISIGLMMACSARNLEKPLRK